MEHFPSALMNANAAWLACAVIAYNLTRAASVLAGGRFAKARTSPIRAKLISIPARIATTVRATVLHLAANHRHQQQFLAVLDATRARPRTIRTHRHQHVVTRWIETQCAGVPTALEI